MKKTLIAVPTTGQMNYRFVESLLGVTANGRADVCFHASSLVYDARNALCKKAIDGGCDFMLWLDSDMVFTADLLERMKAAIDGADALTAVYHSRRAPFKPLIYDECGYRYNVNGELTPIATEMYEYPHDGPFRIAACGFGCVLVRTDAIKRIYDNQGLPFSPYMGFGEDLSFCLRMKKEGMVLMCDPRIQVGHVAEIVIDGATRERWVNVLNNEVIKGGK